MSNILILAPPKSGTTILFEILRASLNGETVGLFEPDACQPADPDKLAGKNVVSKVLFQPTRGYAHYGPEACAFFDKRVFIQRDPRDMLVSYLLYVAYNLPITSNFLAHAQFISTLRAKERAPGSISVLDLFRLQQHLVGMRISTLRFVEFYVQSLRFAVQVSRRHGAGICRIKYEDIVDRKFAALQEYLGFPLAAVSDVAPQHARVARSKGYGEWRNWFLPEDVEYFRPRFAEFMAEFAYDDEWRLAERPEIAAKNGSGYLMRLGEERRHFSHLDYSADSFPAELSPLCDPAIYERDYLIPDLRSKAMEVLPCQGARIDDPHLATPDGQRVNVLTCGRRYVYRYDVEFSQTLKNVSFWCLLRNRRDEEVWATGTPYQNESFPTIAAGARMRVEVGFTCDFRPDVYFLNAGVNTSDDGVAMHTAHRIVNAVTLIVREPAQVDDADGPRITVRSIASTGSA